MTSVRTLEVSVVPLLMPVDDSDSRLVVRVQCGDSEALAMVFERHSTALLRVATGLMQSRAEADDVVQDVFVGLALALRGYSENGTFAAWLRGMTVRTALARRRRLGRRHEVSLLADIPHRAVAARVDTRAEIDDALCRLPTDLRDVFLLKVVEGYSHAEIGDLLNIRPGTSEVRLHRAIRRLRRFLSDNPSR